MRMIRKEGNLRHGQLRSIGANDHAKGFASRAGAQFVHRHAELARRKCLPHRSDIIGIGSVDDEMRERAVFLEWTLQ